MMTVKEFLSNKQGLGSYGSKPFERQHGPTGGSYSYPGPAYPPYSPPPMYHGPPSPPAIFKHYSINHSKGGSGGGSSAALSALTLLSFLFFLHILQGCLKEQMASMTPQVMVMSTGRNPMSRTEKPVTDEPEKVYTLIDGTGRHYPEHSGQKQVARVKIVKVDSNGEPIKTDTVYVNAMADGVGEIINESHHINK